jgi:hypothetical protein
MARSITIIAGQNNVELPNGLAYSAENPSGGANGPTVYLSDDEGAQLNPAAAGVVYVDNGPLVGPVRSVTLIAGSENVQLPNGMYYDATNPAGGANGPTVYLDAAEGSALGNGFTEVLVDNGWLPVYAVTTQAPANALGPVPALTSAQIAAAPTEAEFNALQADVAALRAWLVDEYTALTTAGGPQA